MKNITTIPTNMQIGDLVSLMRLPEATLDQQIDRYSSVWATDSQDIFSATEDAETDVTGVMIYARDGEELEVWVCKDSRPYMNTSTYQRIR